MFGSFPPSPLVGSRLQSLLGPGSRHCLWNHVTYLYEPCIVQGANCATASLAAFLRFSNPMAPRKDRLFVYAALRCRMHRGGRPYAHLRSTSFVSGHELGNGAHRRSLRRPGRCYGWFHAISCRILAWCAFPEVVPARRRTAHSCRKTAIALIDLTTGVSSVMPDSV